MATILALEDSPEAPSCGYASVWHFFMKLFFAAPLNGLPSLLTAFGSHASFLHFVTNAVFEFRRRFAPAPTSKKTLKSEALQRSSSLMLRAIAKAPATALPTMAYGNAQAQRLLADCARRPLHRFRDFGDGRLALRVRLEITNMFFSPSDTLSSSLLLSVDSHESSPV